MAKPKSYTASKSHQQNNRRLKAQPKENMREGGKFTTSDNKRAKEVEEESTSTSPATMARSSNKLGQDNKY